MKDTTVPITVLLPFFFVPKPLLRDPAFTSLRRHYLLSRHEGERRAVSRNKYGLSLMIHPPHDILRIGVHLEHCSYISVTSPIPNLSGCFLNVLAPHNLDFDLVLFFLFSQLDFLGCCR